MGYPGRAFDRIKAQLGRTLETVQRPALEA
jgi:hypothetical protein